MFALHELLEASWHTVVDFHEKPEIVDELKGDKDFADIRDLPSWFKYACKFDDSKPNNISVGVNMLVARPGAVAHEKPLTGRLTNLRDATKAHVLKLRSKPSEKAVTDAFKIVAVHECLPWQQQCFIEACIEIARVLKVDDHLIRELNDLGEEDEAATHWSLYRRISDKMKAVSDFQRARALNPSSKTKQPGGGDIKKMLERMKSEFEKLREQIKIYSAFSDLYRDPSFKYQVVTIHQFCKWCSAQAIQQSGFLEIRYSSYCDLCKAYRRHPHTPGTPQSWPPKDSQSELAEAPPAAPAQ
jgi:hypothetical protein